MAEASSVRIARKPLLLLGGLSTLGVLVCGLSYLIALPPVTPAMLLSGSFDSLPVGRGFGALQAGSVLLYAFTLLPVGVALSVRHYRINPAGMIIGGCITGVSVLMEIFNNLPALTALLYPAALVPPPPELAACLRQAAWIRYVSFDVAGFTLAFAAGLLYAVIFRRKQSLLAWIAIGSVGIFLLHLPFLWISPTVAVALMGLSICLAGCTPLIYARLASE